MNRDQVIEELEGSWGYVCQKGDNLNMWKDILKEYRETAMATMPQKPYALTNLNKAKLVEIAGKIGATLTGTETNAAIMRKIRNQETQNALEMNTYSVETTCVVYCHDVVLIGFGAQSLSQT